MSLAHTYRSNSGHFNKDGRSVYARTSNMGMGPTVATTNGNYYYFHPYSAMPFTKKHDFSRNVPQIVFDQSNYEQVRQDLIPSSKRRKLSALSGDVTEGPCEQKSMHNIHADERQLLPFSYLGDFNNANLASEKSSAIVSHTRVDDAKSCARAAPKRARSQFEDDEVVMSRDEIERHSPSRKDGIDALQETHLRYSYCTFLQNIGVRLDLPLTTVGTAMVLCHRFFARRSHASHDRFLIATAALFLASKSEETPRPLNDVLRVSCEVFHRQDFTFLSYMFPIDWFEQYRERITEAEQLVLTTLNFELNVQHPYDSLTSTLQKTGFAQSEIVNRALDLVSMGVYRGLACSCYDIISWRLMCCSSHVLLSHIEIHCGMWMPISFADTFMTCSVALEASYWMSRPFWSI